MKQTETPHVFCGYLITNTLTANSKYTVSRYRIVENFGGGKHWRIWRIKQRFTKVLPSKFYQKVERLLVYVTGPREHMMAGI